MFPLACWTQNVPPENPETYDFGDIDLGKPLPPAPVDQLLDPYASMLIKIDSLPQPMNLDLFLRQVGYPPLAKEAEIEGEVIVRILVDASGYCQKNVVLKDPHPILTKGLLDHIKLLRFKPGIQNGNPVSCWVTFFYIFSLDYPAPLQRWVDNIDGDQWFFDAVSNQLPFDRPATLTSLCFSGHRLVLFPWRILVFSQLERLDLSHNLIRSVLPEIAGLKMLQYLDLSDNKLKELPKELLKMPNLKSLVVNGNQFPVELQEKWEQEYGGILLPKDNFGKVIW